MDVLLSAREHKALSAFRDPQPEPPEEFPGFLALNLIESTRQETRRFPETIEANVPIQLSVIDTDYVLSDRGKNALRIYQENQRQKRKARWLSAGRAIWELLLILFGYFLPVIIPWVKNLLNIP